MPQTLHAGDTIGRYRIVAPIGAGGMGEVYKAVDDALDRAIAIKVLPRALTGNDDRLRRFVQEAKSASSLTHPNIITIHEIGSAVPLTTSSTPDEPHSAAVHYIAMELVDGRTLKREIHEERTDLRTLISHLAQAADGLAKAHAAGIVHRDLKPDNIMVTRDGFAKILDFGLAKLTERSSFETAATNAPTAVMQNTREGTIMGTVAYMSPEQVQGKPVDERSDVFSFGCILYEAATRQQPFAADSDVDVMHRILHDKPRPVDEMNPAVPTDLRRIIRRCLAKERERRYQSMKDVAIELTEIVEDWDELSTSTLSASSGSTSATVVPRDARRRRLLGAAIAVAVLAALATGALIWLRSKKTVPQDGAAFTSMRIAPLTGSGDITDAAISPDGKYVAHVRRRRDGFSLNVRQIATGSDVSVVPGAANLIEDVVFSPDGDYIFYRQVDDASAVYSSLYQVPTLGGRPRKILHDVDTEVGFSPDGKQLAFLRGAPQIGETYLMVASVNGTALRKVTVQKAPETYRNVAAKWSPDGKRIAAFRRSSSNDLLDTLVMIDPASGKEEVLGTKRFWSPSGLTWLPDGSSLLLVAAESFGPRQIWKISYPDGNVQRVTNDVGDYETVSLTSDGTRVVATQGRRTSNLALWKAGMSEPRPLTSGSAVSVIDLAASRSAVYFMAVLADTAQIWTAGIDGTDPRPIISDMSPSRAPAVPQDGSSLYFESLHGGRSRIWRAAGDGSNPQPFRDASTSRARPLTAVSPSGDSFLYQPTNSSSLVKVAASGSGKEQVLADGYAGGASYSPDGKYILGMFWRQLENGPAKRVIQVIPSNGGKVVNTFAITGENERWSPDGKFVTNIRNDQGVSNIWREPVDGGPGEKITSFTSGVIYTHIWTSDGSLMLGRGEESSDAVLISNFR